MMFTATTIRQWARAAVGSSKVVGYHASTYQVQFCLYVQHTGSLCAFFDQLGRHHLPFTTVEFSDRLGNLEHLRVTVELTPVTASTGHRSLPPGTRTRFGDLLRYRLGPAAVLAVRTSGSQWTVELQPRRLSDLSALAGILGAFRVQFRLNQRDGVLTLALDPQTSPRFLAFLTPQSA